MEKIYTIIIPHHNIPELLRRCLSSIPTRDDLQTIVVDDNSDPIYLDTLKNLAKIFPHIEFVFLNENKGGGHARNVGLSKAKGRYVMFADADDFFMYCLNDVLDDYENCQADMVFFDAISQDTDTFKVSYRVRHLNRMMLMYMKNPQKAEKQLRYVFGEPWCRLIKRSVIEDNTILFDEYMIHNDRKFSYLAAYYCKSVIVDQRAIYSQTVRIGSVSKTNYLDKLLIRTKVYGELNRFYKENHIDLYEEKALRPMMGFLVHWKLFEYRQCKKILKECGMSSFELTYRQFLYPYYLTKKIITNVKEILVRMYDVSK